MRRFWLPIRRSLAAAFGVGLVLALAAPAVALAANTATFSSFVPAKGSSSTVSKPSVSVRVYDRYGVRGSSTSWMWIDGRSVKPTRTYTDRDSYKRFKLSYRVATPLTLGSHRITVKVRDLKKKTSTYTWTFNVTAAEMPLAGIKCVDCHAGYPTAHPMAACEACHSATAPARPGGGSMNSYLEGDLSAHTLSCATSRCHRGGGAFPHTLDSDCTRCHTTTVKYDGIPAVHSQSLEAEHTSTSTFCTSAGCHLSSLTKEHYRRIENGERLTCATCHESDDKSVIGAIEDGDTACESCHGDDNHIALHAVVRTDTCVGSSCHPAINSNLVTLHPACATCHGSSDPDVVAAITGGNTACASCHDFTNHAALHAVVRNDTCVGSSCHPASNANLTTLHPACATCHDSAKPAVVAAIADGDTACASCHDFSNHFTQHEVTRTDTCVGSSCHPSTLTNLMTIHASCAQCHESTDADVVTAIESGDKACASCHDFANHTALHDVVRNDTCVGSSCHPASNTNLMTIHASCAQCHESTDADVVAAIDSHSKACSSCHDFTNHTAQHNVLRTDSCVGSSCHPVTNANLTTLHPTCATCHASTDADVIAAIAGDHKACASCHDFTNHTALHEVTRNDTCVGASCHPSTLTNLMTLHSDCAVCHESTDADVVAAIDSHSKACSSCHDFTNHTQQHEVVRNDTCVGASCHPSTLTNLMTIHPNCVVCHESTDADVVAAIAGHDKACASCHDFTNHTQQHDVVRNDTCVGAACHPSTLTNLMTIHPNCVVCHESTDADVVAAIAGHDKACSSCHEFTNHTALHDVTRTDTCVGASCHPSTLTNLMTIHPDCVVCHESTDADVVAAIAGHDKACASCHEFTNHTALHEVTRSDTCVGASCHPSTLTNLMAIHPNCVVCHESTDADVIAAIDGHDKACSSCHDFTNHTQQHEVVRNDTCVGAACHPNTLTNLMTIHPNCVVCHESTDADVVAAIDGHDKACASCHDFTNHTQQHEVVRNDTCVGAACHPNTLTNLMTIHPNCVVCHESTDADVVAAIAGHDKACASCHDFTNHTALHNVLRTDSCVGAACHPVTNANLTTLHPTCATCHDSTDADVIAAIDGHDKACSSCHDFTNHTQQHEVVRNDTCVGAACHPSTLTNLMTIHPTCVVCHESTDADVVAAIAGHDKACASCHEFTNHTQQHEVVRNDTCVGASCHPSTLTNLMTIHPNCVVCHESTDADVIAAIDGHDKACASCHDFTNHTQQHEVVRNDTCVGAACHPSTLTNLMTIHPNCVVCHESTDADVVAAIDGHDKACASCHDFTNHTQQHEVTRTDTCVGAACHPNTLTNLMTIHPNCVVCHESTDADVVAAIAGHDKACAACHDFTNHTQQHEVTRNDTCVGAACHPNTLTNLMTIHPTCVICHESTDADVVAAIAGHDKACASCHDFTNHTQQHEVVRNDSCAGASCHPASNANLMTIHPNCVICHESTDANVVAAIAGHDKACESCHATAHQDAHAWCNQCHADLGAVTNNEHDGNLQPDRSCATCHGAPFTMLNGSTWVATPGGFHNTGDSGCNGACHHGETFPPSTAAFHAVTRTDTCVGASCHPAALNSLTTLHPTCATCHGSTDADVVAAIDGGNTACTSCHDFANHTQQHDVTRTDTCVGAACHPATLTNLMTLHPTCVICHDSTAPAVVTAISTHNKACAACHAFANHDAQHAVTRTDTCVGASCHPATLTSLMTIHASCAQCHDSTVPAVVAAISGHNKACATCHAFANHDALHTVTRTDTCVGASCHPATLTSLMTIHASCAQCHESTVPAVIAAISGHNRACATCHAFANHDSLHTVTRTDTCVGASCHPATLTSLMTIHASCAQCHESTVPAVIAAISGHNRACATCHAFANHDAQHTVTRTDTCVGASCHPATLTSLMTIHASCAQCHDSTVPAVIAAISGHNKACATCHAFANHDAQHAVTRTDTCVGASCHPATLTSLMTLHPTCATCHDSTVPAVMTAISSHNRACSACHAFTNHDAQHAVPSRTDGCAAPAGCHPGTSLMTLHPTCATCHDSAVPAVVTAISTHNRLCSACHSTTISSTTLHPTYVTGHTKANSCISASCHQADLITTHARVSCATCHNGTKTLTSSTTCSSTGCHPTVTFASHTAIHNECNNCHSSMGWHSDYYPPSGTVGALGWACTECHTGTVGGASANLAGVNWDTLHSGDSGCSVYECHY